VTIKYKGKINGDEIKFTSRTEILESSGMGKIRNTDHSQRNSMFDIGGSSPDNPSSQKFTVIKVKE